MNPVQPIRDAGVGDHPRDPDQISLLDGLAWLVARWHWLVIPAVVFGGIFFIATWLQPALYTATATFIPEDSGAPAARTGLGGGEGLLALLMDRGGSGYYADVIRSRAVLGDVVDERYVVETEEEGLRDGTLLEIWRLEAMEAEQARKVALARIDAMTEVLVHASGMVSVEVEATQPELAEQVADNIVQAVDQWNRQRRQTSATIERDFIGERVEVARDSLLAVENALQTWLEENRRYSSPEKEFERQRLQRQVDLKQSVYTSLAATYEQVRISAVRNTPAISPLDSALTGLEPEPRPFVPRTIMGIVLGAALGFFAVFFRDWYRRGLPFPASWPRRAVAE